MIEGTRVGLKGGTIVMLRCDACDKQFETTRKGVLKRTHHSCSKTCKSANTAWANAGADKQRGTKRAPHTEETKKLISEAGSGRKHSEESKQLMSDVMKGAKNPMFGRAASQETCEKRRQSMIGKHAGENHPMSGRVNPNWHPWMTTKRASWTREIKKAFNFLCASCRASRTSCKELGIKFCAHHIAPVSNHPELELDLNNGITLCHICHMDAHRLLRQDGDAYLIRMLELSKLRGNHERVACGSGESGSG